MHHALLTIWNTASTGEQEMIDRTELKACFQDTQKRIKEDNDVGVLKRESAVSVCGDSIL